MSDPVLIAAWPRNGRETIRVQLGEFNGRDTVDLRCWYTDKDGSLKPGRSGITLSLKHLPQLAAALEKAVTEAEGRGLL